MATTIQQVPYHHQQLRYLWLFGTRWRVLSMPTHVEPVIEIMWSEGAWVPAVDTFTCPGCRHLHTMRRDRYGHLALPDTIDRRNDTEDSWCEMCQDEHEDRDAWYSACTLCDTRLEVPVRHTGPFTFPVVMEERLVPDDTIVLRMDPTTTDPGELRITHTLGEPTELLDDTGAALFGVEVGEFRFDPGEPEDLSFDTPIRRSTGADRITLEVTPIGVPREVVAKLRAAVEGAGV